jgi:hypothetical protein
MGIGGWRGDAVPAFGGWSFGLWRGKATEEGGNVATRSGEPLRRSAGRRVEHAWELLVSAAFGGGEAGEPGFRLWMAPAQGGVPLAWVDRRLGMRVAP